MYLKPYNSNLPILKKTRRREIIEADSTRTHLRLNEQSLYNSFQDLCKELPNHQGVLIISGVNNQGMRALEILRTNGNLRSEFTKSVNGQTRWQWCLNHFEINNYTSLTFQLATEV